MVDLVERAQFTFGADLADKRAEVGFDARESVVPIWQVAEPAGGEVVDDDDLPACGEEPVAEV